jgi:putative membrane-bound dehydrogenase-like protein
LAFVCLVGLSLLASAAETTSSSGPGGVSQAINDFRIEGGFRIEVVASDPMISSPIAMAFDENGRLFVVELRTSQPRTANLGRVRMLENMNDDGVFQNSTIYADALGWPSAVACYAGGIFVAAAPDILYLKDTKADGIADARQVVLNGFGGTNTLNPDFLPNNFNWGPDNRIYGSSGGIGGEIGSNAGGPRVQLAFADFSFDPKTLGFRAEAGPSESGLCFDSHGRRLTSSYVRPLMFPMYELRYTERNPYYAKPPPLFASADPWTSVYQYGTQPRGTNGTPATNLVNTTRMRNARGSVVYRGRAFPTNYLNNVFIPDAQAHIIRRLVLGENGLEITAQRPVDEPTAEFLMSKDPLFRPVQVINGPDGALYVADMRDGKEQGRIYRIAPARQKRSKLPQVGKVKTYDLVSTMAQGDGWHRDTASRLIYERNDSAAPGLLRGTLVHSRLPQARVCALQALAGLGALNEKDVIQGLGDTEPEVRERAILLSETLFKSGEASDALWGQFRGLSQDPVPGVRYQLAFTLGELQGPQKAIMLGTILARDFNNPWVQNAVLSSVADDAGDVFRVLAGTGGIANDPAGAALLGRVATMIGVSGRQDAVTATASLLARNVLPTLVTYNCLSGLGEGLHRTRSSLPMVDRQGALQLFYTGALNVATDASQPEPTRVAATKVLGVSSLGVGSVADWLLMICGPPTSPQLQSAAVDTLSHYDDPQLVGGFLKMWPYLLPVAHDRAIADLVSRNSQVSALLDAVQGGNLTAAAIPPQQANFLRTHANPQIRARALQLLGPVPIRRPDAIAQFKPALTFKGEPSRGEAIFTQRCAECHVPRVPAGPSFGPALLRARSFSADQLLSSILEPSAEVRPDYATQVVESKEAESLVGILVDENTTTITFKELGGELKVWPVSNIRSVQTQPWSMMPAGLETGLSPQDMADLMEYVRTRAR